MGTDPSEAPPWGGALVRRENRRDLTFWTSAAADLNVACQKKNKKGRQWFNSLVKPLATRSSHTRTLCFHFVLNQLACFPLGLVLHYYRAARSRRPEKVLNNLISADPALCWRLPCQLRAGFSAQQSLTLDRWTHFLEVGHHAQNKSNTNASKGKEAHHEFDTGWMAREHRVWARGL